MKRITLLLAFYLTISFFAFSQIKYEKRIEFDIKDNYGNEKINAFAEKGFIVSARNYLVEKGSHTWRYVIYSKDLEPQEKKFVSVSKKMFRDETFATKERLHTLFKDRKGKYAIVSVNATSGKTNKVTGEIPKKAYIKDMSIMGDYAIFSSKIKNKPYIISVNWKTGQQKLIPIQVRDISSKKIFINKLQIMESDNIIFAYVKAIIDKKKSDIYVLRMNSNGKSEGIFNLTKNIDKNLITYSASKVEEDKYVFTGTYSTSSTYSSEGLYFCQVTKEKVDYIKFNNFLALDDFLSYLPEKRKAKIEKKEKKKSKKGKEFKLNYEIAGHNVMATADGYYFLGEAFYPTYRQETYQRTTTVNGVTTTTTETRSVFDGYQYTHAVLAKYNKEGELVWDKCFEMWPSYKPYFVKRFIAVPTKNENQISMVFASRGLIISKTVSSTGEVIQDNRTEKIETGYSGDKTKYSYSHIDYWFDKYFLAYGSQKIKNKSNKNVKRKRKVYFISKIMY